MAVLTLLLLPSAAFAGWSKPQRVGSGDLLALDGVPSGRVGILVSRRGLGVGAAAPGSPFGLLTPMPGARIHELTNQEVGVVGGGGRVAAWLDWDRTSREPDYESGGEDYGCCDTVRASTRLPNGKYRRQQQLSPPGSEAYGLHLARLPRRRTLLAWRLGDGRLQTSVASPGRPFGRTATVARLTGAEEVIDVAPLRGGKLSITITGDYHSGNRVQTLRGRPERRLSGPFTVGLLPDLGDGRLIVSSDRGGGQVIATSDGSQAVVYTRSVGTRFRRMRTLASRGEPVSVDDVVSGPRGEALVLWNRDHGGKTVYRYAARPAGGRFRHPRTLLRVPALASDPTAPEARAAIGLHGRVLVGLVLAGDGRGRGAYGSAGSLTGGLAPPTLLSEEYAIPDTGDTPRPVIDARGGGAFAWQGDQHALAARYRP